MKIFPAVVLTGVVFAAVVAGAAGYSLRSRATAGFDATLAQGTSGRMVPALEPVVYRAEACGGDYVCDERGAWMPMIVTP